MISPGDARVGRGRRADVARAGLNKIQRRPGLTRSPAPSGRDPRSLSPCLPRAPGPISARLQQAIAQRPPNSVRSHASWPRTRHCGPTMYGWWTPHRSNAAVPGRRSSIPTWPDGLSTATAPVTRATSGAAVAPGVHAGRAADRLRSDRGEGRRTRDPARHLRHRARTPLQPARTDADRRQELLRPRVRSTARRHAHRVAAHGPQGRSRASRITAVQAIAVGHRVNLRDIQGTARPRTTPRPHSRWRDRPRAPATPRADRCHLAQPAHWPTHLVPS